MTDKFFKYIFWFIVFLAGFGMFLTIYLMIRFKGETAERFADQAMIFWLTTAVGGGIGYLLGSSANKKPTSSSVDGTTTADISATITTENKPETIKP